jgi:hypothetical protein
MDNKKKHQLISDILKTYFIENNLDDNYKGDIDDVRLIITEMKKYKEVFNEDDYYYIYYILVLDTLKCDKIEMHRVRNELQNNIYKSLSKLGKKYIVDNNIRL